VSVSVRSRNSHPLMGSPQPSGFWASLVEEETCVRAPVECRSPLSRPRGRPQIRKIPWIMAWAVHKGADSTLRALKTCIVLENSSNLIIRRLH